MEGSKEEGREGKGKEKWVETGEKEVGYKTGKEKVKRRKRRERR